MTKRRTIVWGLAIPVIGAVVIAGDTINDLIKVSLKGESAALGTLGVQVLLLAVVYFIGRWIEARSG